MRSGKWSNSRYQLARSLSLAVKRCLLPGQWRRGPINSLIPTFQMSEPKKPDPRIPTPQQTEPSKSSCGGRFSFRGSGRAEELLRGLIKKRPAEGLGMLHSIVLPKGVMLSKDLKGGLDMGL